jgi:hypothetical protein
MQYPVDKEVPKYTSNTEYRECLRQLFNMNPENYPDETRTYAEEWDTETIDELKYDNDTSSQIMDFIYEKTHTNPLFQEVYDKAAGRMLSLDREIGLCVLFSYDFMWLFHRCIVDFLRSPETFSAKTPSYIELQKKL